MVVNAGSSSLKLSVIVDHRRVADQEVERWDGTGSRDNLRAFVKDAGKVDAIGHRVVHGGHRYLTATRVDEELVTYLNSPDGLAPLHNPQAADGIRALRDVAPDVPSVACFDTTFHTDLSPAAATYALPKDWNQRWSLRRYGAHGLSHAYAVRRAAELTGIIGTPPGGLRVVTCHLGSGASLAASVGGVCVDTTMGLTPLEGLVMATRSGSVDPGLLTWLIRTAGVSADEVDDVLQHRSGLAGLSGTSGDLRDVIKARDAGNPDATLAYQVFIHRLRREMGAMIASAGGLDLLVFTGGIGEHAPHVRMDATAGMGYAGAALDATRNGTTTSDDEIGDRTAAVRTVVVTAGEDFEIARQVENLMTGSHAEHAGAGGPDVTDAPEQVESQELLPLDAQRGQR